MRDDSPASQPHSPLIMVASLPGDTEMAPIGTCLLANFQGGYARFANGPFKLLAHTVKMENRHTATGQNELVIKSVG